MPAARRLSGRMQVAEDGTSVATAVFPRERKSVPDARHFVANVLMDWKVPELADTAELVTSELVTNAVLHARAGVFRVTLRRLGDDQVRLAVVDRSRTLPQLGSADDDEDHGRGLAIVDSVSTQWGADLLPWGKRVWADLETPPKPAPPAGGVPAHATRRAQVVQVLMVAAVAVVIVAATAAQQ
ncbi:ATP-binding protein [Streptomyces sp. NPDC059894]|uniref:ATP-binding protein n=1 Tax=unclassified Streptomyces TaxID=2593676 RepID=UPI0036548B8C